LALLKAGVPQVVAMRYEVSDAYALRLAERFYRHLLADRALHPVDSALALARQNVKAEARVGEFHAVDHATPLVFGRHPLRLQPPAGRSPQVDRRRPRPQPLLTGGRPDLDPHPGFVGRGAELSLLAGRWLAGGGPAVALVQGLAGLGKTGLAAEAVGLWQRRFDWVLAFQSRPSELRAEEFYRQVDLRLTRASKAYVAACDTEPGVRVFLPASDDFQGEDRLSQLRENLLVALDRERVLVVLDNFETNLGLPEGSGLCPCRDPEWDRLLAALAARLPPSGSRVLVTSRHRVKALSEEGGVVWLPLGPLPVGEAGLFLRSDERLQSLVLGSAAEQELARGVLDVSRGHPLILRRLADLAGDRVALAETLERLRRDGFGSLPGVFEGVRTAAERAAEREYLADVSCGAVDLLLGRVSVSARRLLWVATRADEPSTEALLADVWSGRTLEQEQALHIRSLRERVDQLPLEMREALAALPPEELAQLEAVAASAPPEVEPVDPLLAELRGAGLLTLEEAGYGFHELVRERVEAWVSAHPSEAESRTVEQVWRAYGERYESAFTALANSGESEMQDTAAEAGRRAVGYLVRAAAFDALGPFVSRLVTGMRDPSRLRGVIASLRAAADAAPTGEARWRVRTYLADALRNVGQPGDALPLFEEAARECEAAENWSDMAWIAMNWANALGDVGRRDEAREMFLRSAAFTRRAGSREVNVVMAELEALRIDVGAGEAATALPEVERRLALVREWWDRTRWGEKVPEAPHREVLTRCYVTALDIAAIVNRHLERWQVCLDLLGEMEQVEGEAGRSLYERTRTRFNHYGPLIRLGRVGEARAVLEECLEVFRAADDHQREARVLGALADVWDRCGDVGQATALTRQALAVCNRFPDPTDRRISHSNLANYLAKGGQWEESARHELAGLVYTLLVDRGTLVVALRNIAIHTRDAAAAGARYELPTVADLVARPEFDALRQFLDMVGAAPDALQQVVDQALAEVRERATTPETETPPGPPGPTEGAPESPGP
jgi:tetratricopeptide (TPR) repeat protein